MILVGLLSVAFDTNIAGLKGKPRGSMVMLHRLETRSKAENVVEVDREKKEMLK